jgi:hypothetical protein
VRRACRIDSAARYRSALEMREALARALAAPHQTTVQIPAPPALPPRAARPRVPDADEAPPRSRRGLVIGVAGAAGVALLGGMLAVLGIPKPPWGGGSQAAAELLERTRARGTQAGKLVAWLEARPEEAARALAAQAGGDLRRFNEDVDQAATDLKDGFAELALRQLDRADQGFATLCDRFTSEYLEGARAGAEGGARDEYARVTEEAKTLAAGEAAKLEAEFERLSAEIGTRGCDRADGMRARIETAALVRELAGGVLRSAEEMLPASVEAAIRKAEAAAEQARQPAIENEHYLARLREGDEALERARAAQAAQDWRPALEAAELASEGLERTALIGAAAHERAGAEELMQQIDAIEAPVGAMRLAFDSAQRSFGEGEWQTAQRGFGELAPELRARLTAAAPVVETAQRQAAACEPARARGTTEDAAALEQAELDARAKYRAAKFAEATALYAEIEAQCAQIVALAEKREIDQAEAEQTERTKLGELASQKSRAEAARSRAQKSLAALAAAKVGHATLVRELESADALLGESRFAESERAYAAVDAEASARAKQAKDVFALRERVRSEFRSAQSTGMPEATLSAGNALRDAGQGLLTEGDLDGAREKLDGALASYTTARAKFDEQHAAEIAARENQLEQERRAKKAEELETEKLREVATRPRGKLQGLISDLQTRGLPLGDVAAARDQAEKAFKADAFDEAAAGFERASELASRQLEAGKPVLAARADAQAARERALARGASGKPLADAAKRFEAATANLSGGKLQAALEGFRAASASYDATDADPEEIVKLLLSNWDLAWSERDIGLLRRTQSLSDVQVKGFAKVFDDNDSITQRTKLLGITKAGANAYNVQLEYDRRLQAGASVKEQRSQKRVARIEKSGSGWVIASVTQK